MLLFVGVNCVGLLLFVVRWLMPVVRCRLLVFRVVVRCCLWLYVGADGCSLVWCSSVAAV